MGKQIPISTSFTLPNGREVTIETGKLAAQADGSVVVKMGKTMLFASAVSAHKPREGQSFFPLSVDYQEKFAAAGRIPGNFFRREARLSDYEILTSRLVDRAIRPLFPNGYMNDTQIIINLISADKDVMPDAMVALAASAALSVSDIPFAGPISEVRVARINGKFEINPDRSVLKESADLDLIVAATIENVMMVEGEAKECSEKDIVEAIRVAHDAIKVQCEAQLDLAKKVGDKAIKREVVPAESKPEVDKMVKEYAEARLLKVAEGKLEKHERKEQFGAIRSEMKEAFAEKHGEEWMTENYDYAKEYFYKLQKETIREMVMATGVRLGTKLDKLMADTALDQHFDDFILHYNFPAYSVGETKPMRGPGRREVGHANLAHRSLRQVLPDEQPYTLRIVSDILESNGSSSMATVCAGSLALMDAGIKIKAPVSGIAMGLISDGKRNVVLSDILGDEDAIGDMDFKITGTRDGICACQMDIKIEGLSYELLEEALMQAREGRLHILDKMDESLTGPREDLKDHAPRIVEIIIEKSYIGAVIGPGGSIIQELQATTNTVINIEEVDDKGVVNISSNDKASIDAALARIKAITFTPEVGDEGRR